MSRTAQPKYPQCASDENRSCPSSRLRPKEPFARGLPTIFRFISFLLMVLVYTTYLYLKIKYNNTINRKRICKVKQIWAKRIFEIRIEILRTDRKWSCATYYASGFAVKNIQINIHRIPTCYFTLTYLSVPSTE